MSAIKFKIGDTWSDLVLDLVYPVGSLYMSINSTSPAILFGGSWAAIENRMIIGASTTYAVGNTGGSATTTISSANLPTHVHSVGAHSHGLNSHKHSVGAHSHGLNSHKHTYDKVNTPTGSTTLTVDQIPSHKHTIYHVKNNTSGSPTYNVASDSYYGFSGDSATSAAGGGKGHTHTTATTSTNSGAASGSTANSTAFDSGAATGSTANSTAFDTGNGGFANTAMTTISPYYSAYIWRRTA